MQRRNIIKASAKGAAILSATKLLPATGASQLLLPKAKHGKTEQDLIFDESYWQMIRSYFTIPADYINLENGYFSPQASSTLWHHQERERYINSKTSWYMRKEQEDSIAKVRNTLSTFLGCDAAELALTRNTTESLNIIIGGYPWKKGDEVIIGNQDYGSMVSAFKQAEKRLGIVVKIASVPLKPSNDEEVVQAYMSLAGPNTKMIHITHLINLTGQVIPVQKIAKVARAKGIETACDSAHAVAHLDFKISDLEVDYVGASLHKWTCAPLGTGFLWVRKELIHKIWPLMGDTDYEENNIRKFEHQGTRPLHAFESIEHAIQFHHAIGSKLKEARLKYLMRNWTSQVERVKGITILTPWNNSNRNCAIATVSCNGYTPNDLAEKLLKDHKIFTVAIDHPVIKGVRVTPHIYTLKSDTEALVKALITIAQ